MAEPITIARPYARAAFESASAALDWPIWSSFLAGAAAIVADPQLHALIGNPRMASDQLVELVLELATRVAPAASQQPDESAAAQRRESQRSFLALLAHNRRLGLLPQIATRYEQLRAEAEQVADVQVVSARELNAPQKQELQSALEKRLQRHVRLHLRLDPNLLGGALVQYGDYVVDGSLRRRVERLAAALSGA